MKKSVKKLLAFLLSLMLVCGALPSTAFAAGGTTGDVAWSLEGGTLSITGTGEMATYSSSSSPDWEEYSDSIKKITVASGVTKIGNYAFWGLDKVTSVTLNEGLETIGTYAFNYCSALTSITIPSTVGNIGNAAFGNSGIQEITFMGDSLVAAGTNTFKTVSNAKIIVPEGFKIDSTPAVAAKTGTAPFYNNYVGFSNGTATVYWVNEDGTVLETDNSVTAGTTPTYDGETPAKASTETTEYTFNGWSPAVAAAEANSIAVYTATFEESEIVPEATYTVTWKNWDGTVLETDINVRTGTVPTFDGETPTKVAEEGAAVHYVFSGWTPEVTAVTDDAEYTAVFTEEAHTYGEPEWTWNGTTATATFTCTVCGATAHPERYTYSYANKVLATSADENMTQDIKVAISFNGQVYRDVKNIAYPIISYSMVDGQVTVTNYRGYSALYIETPLESLVIPDVVPESCPKEELRGLPVTAISTEAFNNSNSERHGYLKNLTLGNNITTIGASAFEGANGLTTLTIGTGLTTIGENAFKDCKQLTTVTCDSLEEITYHANSFPNGVAFYGPHAGGIKTVAEGTNNKFYGTDAHLYGEPEWTWEDDYSSASATFSCEACDYAETVIASITSEKADGKVTYTATAEFEGETYTDIRIDNVKNGWAEEDGEVYYYKDNKKVTGIVRVEYPDASYGYTEDAQGSEDAGFPADGKGTFVFDENGVLQQELTGLYTISGADLNADYPTYFIADGDTVYVKNGEILWHPGEVTVDDDIYYFAAGNTQIKNKDYIVYRVNMLTRGKKYTFDAEGKLCKYDGLVDIDGVTYYYKDYAKTYAGLIQIDGDYYYINSACKVIKGRSYFVAKTNGLMPSGNYEFDADGKMILGKDGIVKEADGWFYYEKGTKVYKGLFKIGEDYYYAKTNCEVLHDIDYYISKTNGLLPQGKYTFDSEGKLVMLDGIVKNGSTWTYYENGAKVYKGLFKIGNDIYYAKSDCTVVHGTDYYVSKTNGILPQGKYTFDEDGKLVMLDGIVKNGDDWTYYENGAKVYAGLIQIDGKYYYVNSSFKVIHGKSYFVSKTNGVVKNGTYTFDENGVMQQ